MTNKTSERTIRVGYLARVEGEGALYLRLKGKEVAEVRLEIFEPPRFFEALLRGRAYGEVPDITARICGICPIAYQLGSIQAMEGIFGLQVTDPIRNLRRLIYCGEWIESHVLHVAMLHAPDFLGYEDSIRMAKDRPELAETVRMALRLKKLGNEILRVVGGREVHPVNLRVGGFYRLPERSELKSLQAELEWGLEAAQRLVRWTAGFQFPEFERDYESVALRHPEEYPIVEGRIVSSGGLDIGLAAYDETFQEEHVPHSNALHSVITGRGPYLVGPIARYNLNRDLLSPLALGVAREVGLEEVVKNPFRSIIVRSLETLVAVEEAIRIIDGYERPDRPVLDYQVRAGIGFGCTEAPRGICYHRYEVDESGLVCDAKIVPPTSQNQKTIEDDLRDFVPSHLHLPTEELVWRCEQAVRNYDPCISCATHFLRLEVDQEP
ncbi:MAG: Ni/Fe hydrogenase subunit alpha [Acidobacteria bacterium]|nr:Ni/Fe hydrogenase subunit alpha [Acidobacteriota bacterium]